MLHSLILTVSLLGNRQVSSVNISFSYFYAGVNLNISVHCLVPFSLEVVLQIVNRGFYLTYFAVMTSLILHLL